MELIGTGWVVLTIVVAAKGASFWFIPAIAVGSSVIYFLMRQAVFVRFWNSSGGWFTPWAVGVYTSQCLAMGILFLIGYGIGKLF